jgi:hypothetical protein
VPDRSRRCNIDFRVICDTLADCMITEDALLSLIQLQMSRDGVTGMNMDSLKSGRWNLAFNLHCGVKRGET